MREMPARPLPTLSPSEDAATRELLRAGRLEQELDALLADARARHEVAPSPETAQRIALLDERHAQVLDELLDLQRRFLPQALRLS